MINDVLRDEAIATSVHEVNEAPPYLERIHFDLLELTQETATIEAVFAPP